MSKTPEGVAQTLGIPYSEFSDMTRVARKAGGKTVNVEPFRVGAFSYSGGTVKIPTDGKWFVGVDLFTNAAITLPRLGHRGWIPVAEVTCNNDRIVRIIHMQPVLPENRIPRTTKKILTGQAVNVVIMGSSLAEASPSDATSWFGMMFGTAGSYSLYRVPGTITGTNIAQGGAPNAWQLAQVGRAGQYKGGSGYFGAGFPGFITIDKPPVGRSTYFNNTDLVVLTCLANGGDYRLDMIEPIIRQLRKRGIEVIVTTDNPQSWNGLRSTLDNSALYNDGPEVMRIADLYGIELADTAAYVADAHIRYTIGEYTSAIFSDTIHMAKATMAGRTAMPASGHEMWTRAIRSCINIDSTTYGTVTTSYNFEDPASVPLVTVGAVGSFVTNEGGKLRITKKSGTNGQWGAGTVIGDFGVVPPLKNGDTVRIQGTLVSRSDTSFTPIVGLQGGGAGWASNTGALAGTFDVTITANRDNTTAPYILFFGNNDAAVDTSYFEIDNITITVNSTYVSSSFEKVTNRPVESRPLPDVRKVTDVKTPADAFVILPPSEWYTVTSNANRGTLGAHPAGTNSFARRFSSAVGSTADLLTLTTGQRAQVAGTGMVGSSVIFYSINGDAECTIDVYKNQTFNKTITVAAQTLTREQHLAIFTPTQYGRVDSIPSTDAFEIRVTAGTIRIAAIIAWTFDMDFYPPEYCTRFGTWSAKANNLRGPSMPGYGTDTANDYAMAYCPPTGNKLSWILSSNPNSQAVDTWNSRTSNTNVTTSGVNHITHQGNHLGGDDYHYIRLQTSNAGVAGDGFGLHIGGIIITNDR